MARPKNASGLRTRQAILDAALELFGERGFFGTSLRDVAGLVGVRDSALYNYFPSKDALFEALMVAEQDIKRERLSAAVDDPADDPHAVLQRLTRLILEDFARPQQQQLFRILMSDGLRLARAGRLNLVDRMGSGRAHIREAMQRFIDRGWLRKSDPEVLAMAFGGPLLAWRHMLAVDATLPVVCDPATFARQHVEQFLRGAAARPARPAATRAPRARQPRASAGRRTTRQRAR